MLGQDVYSHSPMPGRSKHYVEDLMCLSSITTSDFPPKQKHIVRAECLSLKTSDIEGAQPQLRGYRYINKPEFYNRTWDIERAQPAPQPTSQKERDLSLTTEDIPYARPMKNEFKTNRLGHNPLEPIYKLPSFETRPITPPKFIRDSHTTQDIDGARPEVYFKWKTRNILTTDDIEGSKPKPEKIYKKPNFMDPRDINQVAEFTSKRSVNPLAPEYQVRDEAGNLVTVGFVDGSKPRELVRTSSVAHNRHITTEDIDGAKASTKGLGPFAQKPREHFRNSIDVGDIEGAQMSSLKKAPATKRCTNPVSPEYVYPGHSEEPPPPTAKPAPTSTAEPSNPTYDKNRSRFYGITPPQSAPHTTDAKAEDRKSDLYVEMNKARFYGDDSMANSPKLREEQYRRNESRFYSNTPPAGCARTFEDTLKTGTIHKKKPDGVANAELVTADGFSSSAARFYGASTPSEPRRGLDSRGSVGSDALPPKAPSSVAGSHEAVKPPAEVAKTTTEVARVRSASSASGSRPPSSGYKFTLSRADLKPPSAAGSRSSSLKNSGQQVVNA